MAILASCDASYKVIPSPIVDLPTDVPVDVINLTPTTFVVSPHPTYFPISNCQSSRLHLLDIVILEKEIESIGLQGEPVYVIGNNAFQSIYQDNIMVIINGPACSEGWIFWKVQCIADSVVGWLPESNNSGFLLLPIGRMPEMPHYFTLTSSATFVFQPTTTPIATPKEPKQTKTPVAPPPITFTPIVPPVPPPTNPISDQPECNDGIDNDGDGFTDWDNKPGSGDPECHNKQDDNESY